MKTTPYDQLPLRPCVIAEAVCSRLYTGQEWSDQNRDGQQVDRIETLRRRMTPERVREFADLVDARCRAACEGGARWFIECVRAKDNRGRDQLYVWITHWMVSYLSSPKAFRRRAKEYTA